MEIRDWAGCCQFKGSVTDRFRHLENSAGILTDNIGVKRGQPRERRGVFFNFVGEVSRILFGTLDENDAEYYDEQIRRFEQNSEDTNELLKQVYVIKTTFEYNLYGYGA